MPFEANIAAFPQRKKPRPPPTFLDRGEAPPPHVPAWLPALPDRHTYQATPVYPGAAPGVAVGVGAAGSSKGE